MGRKGKLSLTEKVPLFPYLVNGWLYSSKQNSSAATHFFAEKLSTDGRRPRLCGVLFSAKMCFLYVIATKTSIAEGLSNKIIGKEKFVLENVLQRKKGFLNETQFEEAESESNEKVFCN